MLLLLTTVVSNAQAGGLLALNSGLCNGKPCIGFIDTDTTIVPPDLYKSWLATGDVNYFRVDVDNSYGTLEIDVNGYTLSSRYQSRSESVEGHTVYYIPASADSKIIIINSGRDAASYELSISGVAKANW
jgi:hypothetical protein